MSVLDWAITAGRTAAAVAALPVHLAGQAVAAATGAATGAEQVGRAVLRVARNRRPVPGTTTHPSPVPSPPPAASATPQPPVDPATAERRAPAQAMSGDGIHRCRAADARSMTTGRTSGQGRSASAANPAHIRAWAAANGYEVARRGRMPDKVRQAYAAAH